MPPTRKQTAAMEAARKKSVTVQQLLDNEFQILDDLLNAEVLDEAAVEQQLRDIDTEINNFFEVQNRYIDLLLEANMDDEYTAEETTRMKIRKRRNLLGTQVYQALRPMPPVQPLIVPGNPHSSNNSVGHPDSVSTYRVNLPKREMQKFGGDVRQWRSFWASFQEVDGDQTVPEIEKYNFLLQSMVPGSIAAKVVASFPPADTSYQLAKAELEHRFGRKKTLIKVYVRDLLSLVVENAKEKKNYDFVDVVTSMQSQILNLEQLGVTPDTYGLLLYPIIESCIPVDVLNRYLDMPGVKEELSDIMEFLRNEVRRKEETARAQIAFTSNEKEERKQKGHSRSQDKVNVPTAATFVNANEKNSCGFCSGNHSTAACRKATTMTLEEKKNALKKTGTCFKCLKVGHQARKCGTKITCISCKKNHHALMCFGSEPEKRIDQVNINPFLPQRKKKKVDSDGLQQQQQSFGSFQTSGDNWNFGPGLSLTSGKRPEQTDSNNVRQNADMSNYIQRPEVLLQTLLVQVYSPHGYTRKVRALYDPGSQSSYIKETLAKELRLRPLGKELVVHQTFGGVLSAQKEHNIVETWISGVAEPYLYPYSFQASVVEKMVDNIIAVPQGPWLEECCFENIPLTDVSGVSYEIEVLIGNDVAPYLRVGMRSLQLPSGIIATETRLGWFLEGRVPGNRSQRSNKAMVCVNLSITEKEVENYWALETIGIRDATENRTRAELEEAALQHFNETVVCDETGRFEVHLPWIEGHPPLPENRRIVETRLDKTTKDLIRDGYLAEYDAIFKDWEEQGIIEKVPQGKSTASVIHYLAHRAVYKEGSTTPVRPVFNASGKTKTTPSLNDCLEKGPNLLEIIPSILSRFRMDNIGVISDIKKAFLQLKVAEQHRDCLRFLWWEDITERKKVVEYRHCRVVFGVSSSPFLLGAAIQKLLRENEQKYPRTVQILRSSFYVDNCVASLPSLEEVIKFKEESQEIFLSAQMDLRGWEYGPSSDEKQVSVLGLNWNTGKDTISYDLKRIKNRMNTKCTKRTVLQLANSLYDPLGLLSPFIIVIKIIFKKICSDSRKFGWDSELPEEFVKPINMWKSQVDSLVDLSFPRSVTNSSFRTDWSLHVMSDASKDSYACCIYLRIEGDPVRVQLIQARARVTPMKVLTIPRAELLGCLIAARLYTQVIDDLSLTDIPVKFWTDSSTALTWIKGTNSVYGVFVNRRVEEIRRLTNITDWRHVPGEMNPADIPSRGTSVEKYKTMRWWEGPDWLYGPASSFPNSEPLVDEEAVSQEKRKTVVSAVAQPQCPLILDQLVRLGDWHKVLRVLAYVKRFLNNTRKMKSKSEVVLAVSAKELQDAEDIVIRHIQRTEFVKNSPPANLRPTADTNGVLRVVTKLVEGDEASGFKYPVLLPGNHPLVRLLIGKEHSLASHAGVQYMMSILRQKYWIINCRRSIKAVINKCAICRVHMARKCRVVEAPLPIDRIKTTRCFAVCGVDLAGPLFLKDGQKAWIVLFTCAVYRAVHMELVPSLSTEAFLMALRKFVVRRGRPNTIYSDNGTNFVGCYNMFKKLNWKKVEEYAGATRIKWIFNPPTAAWWGGFWERLVGLAKQLLRRVLGKRSVEYSELEVLVLEVEAILNERPLTYISEDPSDLRPLTPSLFLRDQPVAYLPEAEITEGKLRGNWKHVEKLREQLRNRFRKEYLAQLVHRGKLTKSDQLSVGDVVLVEFDNKKRIEWPMGVILELYPGRDGVTRTARIRTTHGEMCRPLQRLYPLEMKQAPVVAVQNCKELEKVSNKQELPDEGEEDFEVPEDLLDDEPEPVIITRSGRISKRPFRLGIA